MPKRPPQGRGSGGRVTPSSKSASTSASSGTADGAPSGRGRKGRGGSTTTPASGGKASKGSSSATGKASKGSSSASGKTTKGSASAPGKTTKGSASASDKTPKGAKAGATTTSSSASSSSSGSGRPRGRVPTAAPGRGRKGAGAATAAATATATEAAAPRSGFSSFLRPAGADPAAARERPWWGMGDMVLWFFVAQIAAGVAFFVVAGIMGYSTMWPTSTGSAVGEAVGRVGVGQPPSVTQTIANMPLWITTFLQVPLWIGFLGGPLYAAKRKGTSLKVDFGFRMEWRDIPLGLAVGIVTQVVLVTVLYKIIFVFTGEQDVSASARELTDKATSPGAALLVFAVVAVGAPVFEELFFRGLSQRAIGKRLGPIWGLLLAALFFALVHGQTLQFPGLLMFGLILGYLAYRYDRLGPSIWAHVGFNGVTAVLLIWNLNLP